MSRPLVSKVVLLFAAVALAATGCELFRRGENRPPPVRPHLVTVSAEIGGEIVKTVTQEFTSHHSDSEADCGLERTGDKTWCLPDNWRVVKTGLRTISQDCKSSVASPAASGPKCVLVGARVAGCGYESFFAGGRCRGRGFIEYDLTLTGERSDIVPIPRMEFDPQDRPTDGEIRFEFRHDARDRHPAAKWSYQARVVFAFRTSQPDIFELSSSVPTRKGATSRIENGILSIAVKPDDFVR